MKSLMKRLLESSPAPAPRQSTATAPDGVARTLIADSTPSDSAPAARAFFDRYVEEVTGSVGAESTDSYQLAAELRDHLSLLHAELIDSGMTSGQAAAKAISMLGDADRVGSSIRRADRKHADIRHGVFRTCLTVLVLAALAFALLIPGRGMGSLSGLGATSRSAVLVAVEGRGNAPPVSSDTSPANLVPSRTVQAAVAEAAGPPGSPQGLVQLLAKALLFALAGFIGCWACGEAGQRRFLLGVLLVASAVEALQYALGVGVADIDDALICLLGAWLGWKTGAATLHRVHRVRDRAVLRSMGW